MRIPPFAQNILKLVALLAMVAVACLKGVKELMTEKVEATVEHIHHADEAKA